jgi:hypothetical protein
MTARQGFELRDTTWRDDVASLVRRLEGNGDSTDDVAVHTEDTGRRQPVGRRVMLAVTEHAHRARGEALGRTGLAPQGGGPRAHAL